MSGLLMMLSVDRFWKCPRSTCGGHRFGYLHVDVHVTYVDVLRVVHMKEKRKKKSHAKRID